MRRTNEDKQRAVIAALMHPKAVGMSDSQIAKHVGVSSHMVGQYRASMIGSKMGTRTATRKGKTYKIDIARARRRTPSGTPTAPTKPTDYHGQPGTSNGR